MRRSFMILLAIALVAAGALVCYFGPAFAAETPLSGTWKVVILPPDGSELGIWLIKIEKKGDTPKATVIATGVEAFKQSEVEEVATEDKRLRLSIKVGTEDGTVTVPIVVYVPEGEANPDTLRGYALLRGDKLFVQLERSTLKKLDRDDAMLPGASDDFASARRARSMKEAAKILGRIEKDHAEKPAAYYAGLALLNVKARDEASAEDLRKQADAALKIAAAFGPELKQEALAEIARQLNTSDKTASVAVDYARQAEKSITDSDPPSATLPIYKTLASALRKSGKADEAKQLQPRIDKLDEAMDQEYLKDAVPFKPAPFRGRKGESKRIVLVELFTGVQCPPCVASDVAFDALLKTYRPSEAVLLQYHVHVPGPDPLTNEDSEKRSEYYDIDGTPSIYVDGRPNADNIGGPKAAGKPVYSKLLKTVNEALEEETKATLKLTANQKGDAITISADVAGLVKPGEKLRLRFVLIEDIVRYRGRNGQRLHHHVVRAFPGGVEGMKLDKPASTHTASVNLAELSKTLHAYLTAANAKRAFPDDERPLDLKHLKVVAFIQDDDTKKVLQAAEAELEAK